MASAEKYVVRDYRGVLTKAARRSDAFRLAALLGSKYRVWNKVTRRYSSN